ncbi:Uncharacterised protein [Paenibacillus thiaminolyticus]|nr:Uncharacterised protein [Paenibacillus thiaminolyticus]
MALQRRGDRPGDRPFERHALRLRGIMRIHRIRPARAMDDGHAAQQGGDRLGLQRGGHDEDTQIAAQQRLRFERQRQAEIGVQMPLMELIEDEQPTPSSAGSSCSIRVRTPSVMTSTRVAALTFVSRRTR